MVEQQDIHFRGRVQGVGFRQTTRMIARAYSVTGFVQNLTNGTVRLLVEGDPADLDSLVADIKERMSTFIQGVDVTRRESTGRYQSFDIRY